jgi:hypothetical protein
MIARRAVMSALVASFAALPLVGCSAIEPSETLRYRITVEVDTPQGRRSGHAVWEYTVTDIKVGFRPLETDYRGEAVAVDLPGGRTLFALLTSGDGLPEYPEWVILQHYRATPEYKADWERAFLTVFPDWRNNRESWIVPPVLPPIAQSDPPRSGYPMLVTFTDIADPTSVKLVDPADLAASFGPGVSLRAISVQVTDEKVTEGVEKRLVWLTSKSRKKFDPQNKPKGIPLGNYRGLFSTEYPR